MKTLTTVLTLAIALATTSIASARNLYGYIGFGYGVAPVVPCTVVLSGSGQYRVTTGYYHPFGLTKMRYHFNSVPHNAYYNVTVYPQALYKPSGTNFYVGWGLTDYKIPDIWVRP